MVECRCDTERVDSTHQSCSSTCPHDEQSFLAALPEEDGLALPAPFYYGWAELGSHQRFRRREKAIALSVGGAYYVIVAPVAEVHYSHEGHGQGATRVQKCLRTTLARPADRKCTTEIELV